LDTTFPVDVERRAGDLDAVLADDDDVAIAAVTVAELLVGVALAGARQRPARQAFVDDSRRCRCSPTTPRWPTRTPPCS
jgi:tRNA(fMet)-specific endonuclease VapC